MPERFVLVRWPDGPQQRIYSPSTVVEDYFAAGQQYPVPEFVDRCRQALSIASDRVRAAYGFPCAVAGRSLHEVEEHAVRYPAGAVTVEGVEG